MKNETQITDSNVSDLNVGDTISWQNGIGNWETAEVHSSPRIGLYVKLIFSHCTIARLLQIHGSLRRNATIAAN